MLLSLIVTVLALSTSLSDAKCFLKKNSSSGSSNVLYQIAQAFDNYCQNKDSGASPTAVMTLCNSVGGGTVTQPPSDMQLVNSLCTGYSRMYITGGTVVDVASDSRTICSAFDTSTIDCPRAGYFYTDLSQQVVCNSDSEASTTMTNCDANNGGIISTLKVLVDANAKADVPDSAVTSSSGGQANQQTTTTNAGQAASSQTTNTIPTIAPPPSSSSSGQSSYTSTSRNSAISSVSSSSRSTSSSVSQTTSVISNDDQSSETKVAGLAIPVFIALVVTCILVIVLALALLFRTKRNDRVHLPYVNKDIKDKPLEPTTFHNLSKPMVPLFSKRPDATITRAQNATAQLRAIPPPSVSNNRGPTEGLSDMPTFIRNMVPASVALGSKDSLTNIEVASSGHAPAPSAFGGYMIGTVAPDDSISSAENNHTMRRI